jgi:hypothetical protein
MQVTSNQTNVIQVYQVIRITAELNSVQENMQCDQDMREEKQ